MSGHRGRHLWSGDRLRRDRYSTPEAGTAYVREWLWSYTARRRLVRAARTYSTEALYTEARTTHLSMGRDHDFGHLVEADGVALERHVGERVAQRPRDHLVIVGVGVRVRVRLGLALGLGLG